MHKVLLYDYKTHDPSAEIPGLFKRAGCQVEVYCREKSWLVKNNSYDVWHKAKEDKKTYYKGLVDLIKDNSYNWILPTEDGAIEVVRDQIEDKYFTTLLPLFKIENREMLGSKAGLVNISRKYNLRAPNSEIYKYDEDIRLKAWRVTYPLLLKTDEDCAGKGVFLCRDETDLIENFEKLPEDKKKNLVLQKYIKGATVGIEAIYKNGQLLAHTYGIVTENIGTEFNPALKRDFYRYADIKPELENIGKSIGINGFCSFTFIKDENDVHYLIEADLRTHAWFRLAYFVGVDFSMAIKDFINGEIHHQIQSEAHITMINFSRSLSKIIETKDVKELSKWILNNENIKRYITSDRKIFYNILSNIFYAKLGKFVRKYIPKK